MPKNRTLLILVLAYMGGILLFSVLPGYRAVGESAFLTWRVGGSLSTGLHVVVYGGLAWLWSRYLETRLVRVGAAVLLAAAIATAYGVLNEWLQLYVPGRSGSIRDVVFNSIGALGGIGLAAWVSKRRSATPG